MELERYLASGVSNIIKGAVKASISNPEESLFMAQFALSVKTAKKNRETELEKGNHIPAFLICSITGQCNLRCRGCYAWETHICGDDGANQLTADKWESIFEEAESIGVSFILLAGGEPLMRPDVIERAGSHSNILFPVFTNGTIVTEDYIDTFTEHRNLLPVVSIEGGRRATDDRRGEGVYDAVKHTMEAFNSKGILFGASVTVTKENMYSVTEPEFIQSMGEKGCKFVIFVEYVALDETTENLSLEDEDRKSMKVRIDGLKSDKKFDEMLFISFPGDEKSSGGCLAAGRGFFHINASGGCEPCPFSPYSDVNVGDVTLIEALKSPLFTRLISGGILREDHDGGCVLFKKRKEVSGYEQEFKRNNCSYDSSSGGVGSVPVGIGGLRR